MKKVELGCGKYEVRNKDCNVHVDKADFGYNIICNFEKDTLPFEDDSVDYIYSNHMIEHLRDVQIVMNEAWRVLKKGGEFYIKVPYGLWPGASKPVHHQSITACWFDWFRRKDLYEWYGYRSWDIKILKEITNTKGVIYEVECVLTPRK